jgi:hypothetical protein
MPSQPIDDIGHALALALDPVLFCQVRLDFTPDPWQAKFRAALGSCVQRRVPVRRTSDPLDVTEIPLFQWFGCGYHWVSTHR